MSKSQRNTIDPGAIIDRYGADTARWFILSDNPPDRDMEWTESGAAGAYRFTQRMFRLAEALDGARGRNPAGQLRPRRPHPAPRHPSLHRRGDRGAGEFCVQRRRRPALRTRQRDHRGRTAEPGSRSGLGAARSGGDDGAAVQPDDAASRRGDSRPRCPGQRQLVAELPWPEADPALLVADSVTIAVQVGQAARHHRGPPDAPAEAVIAAAEADPNVAKALEGKRIVKRVHVPEPHRQLRGGRMRALLSRRFVCACGCRALRARPAAASSRSICRRRRASPGAAQRDLQSVFVADHPGAARPVAAPGAAGALRQTIPARRRLRSAGQFLASPARASRSSRTTSPPASA